MASGNDTRFVRELAEKRSLGGADGEDLLRRNSDLGIPTNRAWWRFNRPATKQQTQQQEDSTAATDAVPLEFDADNQTLQQQIDRLKAEYRESKVENGRLVAELAALKRSLKADDPNDKAAAELQATNRQLQAECEAYRQELSFKSEQMKLLRQNNEISEDFLAKCQPFIDSAIAEYRRQFTIVQEENEILKDRLRELNHTAQTAEAKLIDSRRAANDATVAYQNLLGEQQQFTHKESDYLQIIKANEAELEELKAVAEEASAQTTHYQEENKLLQDVVRQMDLRIGELEASEFDLQNQLRGRSTETEEAKLDKERADTAAADLQRELEKQIERMQQASERYKDSLKSMRQELQDAALVEKNKLLMELQEFQALKAESDLQSERAMREKRMAEKELESVKKIQQSDLDRFNNSTEDLTERIRRLERERDALLHKIESRQNKENADGNLHEKERRQLTSELETTHQRLRRLEKECEDAKEDKINIYKRLLDTESRLRQLQDESEEADNAHSLAISTLTRKYETEAKEQKTKMLQAEEGIKVLTADLQNLLMEQKRTAVRWKEESKRAADNYEHLLEEARQKLAAAQSKIDVLNEKCIQLATLKDDLTDELNEERKNHSKLHSLIKGAEQRAQNSARQIQDMLGRERELLNERKDFQRKIDQFQLEKQRWDRERMLNDKRQQLLSGGKKFSRSAFAVKDDSLVDLDFVLQPLASKISGDDLDLEVAKENLPDL